MIAKLENLLNLQLLKKDKIFKKMFVGIIYLLFLQPKSLTNDWKLSDGVIGNTSGFGPEEFRFET